jgi:hypothetical protein
MYTYIIAYPLLNMMHLLYTATPPQQLEKLFLGLSAPLKRLLFSQKSYPKDHLEIILS